MIDVSVYLVAGIRQLARGGCDPLDTAAAAVAGGVSAIQIREKDAPDRDIVAFTAALAQRLGDAVSLIVDDRVDLFLAARGRGIRLAGVHVGQGDLPAADVRRLVGGDAIVGVSAGTPAQLAEAASSPARVDYVGIGAVHPTQTKLDAPEPLGVAAACALAAGCPLPAVAIGGITAQDAAPLRAGGFAGLAASSWVCAADDPADAARRLAAGWAQGAR